MGGTEPAVPADAKWCCPSCKDIQPVSNTTCRMCGEPQTSASIMRAPDADSGASSANKWANWQQGAATKDNAAGSNTNQWANWQQNAGSGDGSSWGGKGKGGSWKQNSWKSAPY